MSHENLILLALQIEATSVLVQELQHLTNKLIKMPSITCLLHEFVNKMLTCHIG